jgi:hypothetical protein
LRLGVEKAAAGGPVAPARWDHRTLPTPTCRSLVGGPRTAGQDGPQGRAWPERPGIRQTGEVIASANGAKRVCSQAEQNLPGVQRVADICHGSEHPHGTANVPFGDRAVGAVRLG